MLTVRTLETPAMSSRHNVAILECREYLFTQNTKISEVPPNVAASHRGNFYGVLEYLQIDSELYYPTLLINNLLSPTDYRGDDQVTTFTDSLTSLFNILDGKNKVVLSDNLPI